MIRSLWTTRHKEFLAVRVPRARLVREDVGTADWQSKALRRYQRLTKRTEALIAGTNLAGTNTRRVRRALAALFDDAVSEKVVSNATTRLDDASI